MATAPSRRPGPRPAEGLSRLEQTALRRQEILDAALATFNEVGESGTFIQEVCTRAGVSVGTLYHHFGSKDQLIATLHFTLLNAYQSGAGPILAVDPPAEPGIRQTVSYHARWLVGHRDEATFLLQQPFAGYRSDQIPGELRADNDHFLATVRGWLDRRMDGGELRRLPFDVVVALMIGPIHHWARAELFLESRVGTNRGTHKGRDEAITELGDGVWHALRPHP